MLIKRYELDSSDDVGLNATPSLSNISSTAKANGELMMMLTCF